MEKHQLLVRIIWLLCFVNSAYMQRIGLHYFNSETLDNLEEIREVQNAFDKGGIHLLQFYEDIQLDEIRATRTIKDGIPDEYRGNLTADCLRDFNRYGQELQAGTTWALRMLDATGFTEPGKFQGNFLAEGRYKSCIKAQEENTAVEAPIQGMHCLTYWNQGLFGVGFFRRGQGICIPDTCTDNDADSLIRAVYQPSMLPITEVGVHCERDNRPLDAEAIITIIILSIFGLLLFLGTAYHAWKMHKEDTLLEHPKNAVIPSTVRENGIAKAETVSEKVLDSTVKEVENNDTYVNVNVPQSYVHHKEGLKGRIANGISGESGEIDNPAYEMNELEIKPNGIVKTIGTEQKQIEVEKHEEMVNNKKQSIPEKMLLTFSMYVNMPLITSTKQPKGAYLCINGLRVIAMSWVILGHTYALGTQEYPPTVENEFTVLSRFSDPWFAKLYTADLYVDTFFVLSSFLMTISFLKKLNRTNGKLGARGWFMHYFSRYWRIDIIVILYGWLVWMSYCVLFAMIVIGKYLLLLLLTPTYMLLLMFCTNLFHYFVKGPFMKEYIYMFDSCADVWWANLLYINIYTMNLGDCMGHSWYLCVDWQMFVIAPLFLYILWRKEKLGIAFIMAGICGGLVANIVLHQKLYTQDDNTPEEDLIDSFTDIYIVPWTRCVVYFMGMLLGWLFYKTKGEIKIPKVVVAIGWFVALWMFFIPSYFPALQNCTEASVCGGWTVAGRVAFDTLKRPMWAMWVSWVILACSTGYGGFVNTFLSWNLFVPLGNLSYLCYLIHPLLCFMYFYQAPIQQYYTDYFFSYLFCANMVLVYAMALACAVAISAPLGGLMAVFLPNAKSKAIR